MEHQKDGEVSAEKLEERSVPKTQKRLLVLIGSATSQGHFHGNEDCHGLSSFCLKYSDDEASHLQVNKVNHGDPESTTDNTNVSEERPVSDSTDVDNMFSDCVTEIIHPEATMTARRRQNLVDGFQGFAWSGGCNDRVFTACVADGHDGTSAAKFVCENFGHCLEVALGPAKSSNDAFPSGIELSKTTSRFTREASPHEIENFGLSNPIKDDEPSSDTYKKVDFQLSQPGEDLAEDVRNRSISCDVPRSAPRADAARPASPEQLSKMSHGDPLRGRKTEEHGLCTSIISKDLAEEVVKRLETGLHSKLSTGVGAGSCFVSIALINDTVHTIALGDCLAAAVSLKPTESITKPSFEVAILNRPHRSSSTSEINRIRLRGGFVKNGRIAGILEPSRTIGDFDLKRMLPAGVISTVPDVAALTLKRAALVILGTDGVWDVMDVPSILKTIRKHKVLWQRLLFSLSLEALPKGVWSQIPDADAHNTNVRSFFPLSRQSVEGSTIKSPPSYFDTYEGLRPTDMPLLAELVVSKSRVQGSSDDSTFMVLLAYPDESVI